MATRKTSAGGPVACGLLAFVSGPGHRSATLQGLLDLGAQLPGASFVAVEGAIGKLNRFGLANQLLRFIELVGVESHAGLSHQPTHFAKRVAVLVGRDWRRRQWPDIRRGFARTQPPQQFLRRPFIRLEFGGQGLRLLRQPQRSLAIAVFQQSVCLIDEQLSLAFGMQMAVAARGGLRKLALSANQLFDFGRRVFIRGKPGARSFGLGDQRGGLPRVAGGQCAARREQLLFRLHRCRCGNRRRNERAAARLRSAYRVVARIQRIRILGSAAGKSAVAQISSTRRRCCQQTIGLVLCRLIGPHQLQRPIRRTQRFDGDAALPQLFGEILGAVLTGAEAAAGRQRLLVMSGGRRTISPAAEPAGPVRDTIRPWLANHWSTSRSTVRRQSIGKPSCRPTTVCRRCRCGNQRQCRGCNQCP